ncbi:MAG TPA: hypothetical protein VJ837_03525 [Candidatus Paceibacterota bacterium]|nr:hypothetical protein [Candidatus Paceibacterota bacterium]
MGIPNRDELEGKAKQAAADVKRKAGDWTDDPETEIEADEEEAEGEFQEEYGRIKREAGEEIEEAGKRLKR